MIGPQRLRAVSAVGETFPLYCTANGKAYLAGLDEVAVARLIGTSFERRTASTITRLDDLVKEFKAVRKSGVAFDRGHTPGICARPAWSCATSWATTSRSPCRCRRNGFMRRRS